MSGPSPVPLPSVRNHPFDPPELCLDEERRPICRLRYPDGHLGWLVTSHELAKAVLLDARFGTAELDQSPVGDPARAKVMRAAMEAAGFPSFLGLDPPDHMRYKRMVASHFSASGVAAMTESVEAIVAERLDAIEAAGPPADLVRSFAAPVSLATQCMLLGIPAAEAGRFYRLGTNANDRSQSVDDVAAAWRECGEYVRSLVADRRREPRDDIVGEVAGRPELSAEEAAGIIILLMLGGLETTGDMLALATFALLCNPSQLEALRADPALAEPGVEELLRYGGIFRLTIRTAREDVELGGETVRCGDRVTVSLATANRDPAAFPEPERLELANGSASHLAFGKGVHMCLGQRLARLELKTGLVRLLERFPTLHLDVPAEQVPVYNEDQANYGVRELPVSW